MGGPVLDAEAARRDRQGSARPAQDLGGGRGAAAFGVYSTRREDIVETPLKTLIDRFRAKPEGQHPDPAVRAEAVLRLHAHDGETLLAPPPDDPEPRGRGARGQ